MGVVLLTGGVGPVGTGLGCGSGGVALTGSSPFPPGGSATIVPCLLFNLANSSFSSDMGCSVGVATLGVI